MEYSMLPEKEYRLTSKEGDWVWLPNGELGVIVLAEIICAGNVKEVRVVPIRAGRLKRFFYCLFRKRIFYDDQINDLEPANRLKNICS